MILVSQLLFILSINKPVSEPTEAVLRIEHFIPRRKTNGKKLSCRIV